MDEIYTIMQRLALIEGSITPTNELSAKGRAADAGPV